MLHYNLLLIGALSIFIVPNAADMTCNVGGILITCPTLSDADDKYFCCERRQSFNGYCCNFEEYFRTNNAAVALTVVSIIVFVIIVTICCCCFCSCCYLAKRRTRGHVIYVPAAGQVASISTPAYQQIHLPPTSQVYNPPLHNPNYAENPAPYNPYH